MADETTGGQSEKFRLTRIYTRTGDEGMSQLVGGQRVPKNHPRLNAYGTVDELQVSIGAARDALTLAFASLKAPALDRLRQIEAHLIYLQNMLFTVSGDLATRLPDRWLAMPLPSESDVQYMEGLIDALNQDLPPLKDFILPGGHPRRHGSPCLPRDLPPHRT